MRRIYIMLLLCILITGARGQTIYRYWLDNNETTQQTVSGTGEQQFSINVSSLAREHLHALHVQAYKAEEGWSTPLTHFFFIPAAEASVSTTARYWFDNDETTEQGTNTVDGVIDIDVTGLSAGLHAVHYQTFGQDGKPSSVLTDRFYIEDTNNERLTCKLWFDDEESVAVVRTVTADGIELDASSLDVGDHTLYIALFDEYGVYVGTETADFNIPVPTETITLAKAAGGTFCTSMDLDFSGIQGLKAYIACGFNPDEGVVWVMRVDYVPADEGIFIKGTPGTYEVPYRSTGFRYNNMLVGSHVKRTLPVSEDGYYNYVLKDGLFCPSNGAASVGANKAYLRIPTQWIANQARSLTIELTEEPTGIAIIRNDHEGTARYYNMKGQRIEHPQKGLYILNGKKVIIR